MTCIASIFEAKTSLVEVKDSTFEGTLFNTGDTFFLPVDFGRADAFSLSVLVGGEYPVDFSGLDPSSIVFRLSVIELDTWQVFGIASSFGGRFPGALCFLHQ